MPRSTSDHSASHKYPHSRRFHLWTSSCLLPRKKTDRINCRPCSDQAAGWTDPAASIRRACSRRLGFAAPWAGPWPVRSAGRRPRRWSRGSSLRRWVDWTTSVLRPAGLPLLVGFVCLCLVMSGSSRSVGYFGEILIYFRGESSYLGGWRTEYQSSLSWVELPDRFSKQLLACTPPLRGDFSICWWGGMGIITELQLYC